MNTRDENFEKLLPVTLTPEERHDYEHRLAATVIEKIDLQGDKTTVVTALNDEIKALVSAEGTYAEVLKKNAEDKMVQCTKVAMYNRGVFVTRRLDTDRIIDLSDMSSRDRQLGLGEEVTDDAALNDEVNAYILDLENNLGEV